MNDRIDWEILLRKYVRYVAQREGSDFIEEGHCGLRGFQEFTEEEWDTLAGVSAETQV